jgi:GNAT superfamily N-acetyltransferase
MRFKQWFEAAQIVNLSGESFDFDDEEGDRDTLIQQAWELAKQSPIRILRDKELNSAAVMNGQVVGALFTAWNQNEFSFDVVVAPQFQQQGIGKQLIDVAMGEFRWMSDGIEGAYIKADVVNPHLIPLLQRLGFVMQQQAGGHTIMTYGVTD